MTIDVGVGGAHKGVLTLDVGVGGVWKPVMDVKIGVNGEWRLAYALVVALPAVANGATFASIIFSSDGAMNPITGDAFTWLPGGNAADFDIYVTGTGIGAASTPTGSAVNTWLNLGTTRTWSLSTTQSFKSYVGTYQIRHSASQIVLGSAQFDISVEGSN